MKFFFCILYTITKALIFTGLVLCCTDLFALQNNPADTIRGIVLSELNEPLPGISITVKGTERGTTSDAKGHFLISGITKNVILVFTGIHTESVEISSGSSGNMEVTLKFKATYMQDVLVEANTGYQTAKPNEINSSLVVIDNKTLNQQVGTNILKRLENVTSGLLFDNNKLIRGQVKNDNISIRGLSTINASLSPLIILDNFIYEGDINNINPNDVESITVLKDASATSIWGARAGNGVIVITTKKGKLNEKAKISVNLTYSIGEKPDLFYLPNISSSDYIDLEQYLFKQGYFDNAAGNPYQPLTPAVELFLKRRDGLISAADSAKQVAALKAVDTRDQYKKYVYRNPFIRQYAIGLRGGNNNSAYTFSVGYDNNLGELRDRFDKLNIKIDNLYRPVKGLQLSLGIYYTNSKAVSGMQAYGSTTIDGRQVPYIRLADDNGNPISVAASYRDSYTDTAGGNKLLDWKYYPLEDYKHEVTTVRQDELFANISLQYNIARYLNIDLKYQYQKQQVKSDQLSDIESYSTRNLINLFSRVDPATGEVSYTVPMRGILNSYNATIQSQTARGQLNFNNTWGDHSVAAILGSEIRQAKTVGNNNIVYGYNEDPLSYSVVDMITYFPTFVDGSYQSIPNSLSFSNTVNRFISFYGNASYTYRHRYTLSGSARRDGSNIFGANTNDRWKPLWSAGIGWNLSEESFYRTKLFKFFKLRATYGYSGNVDLNKTSEAVALYLSGAPSTNFPFTRIRSLNNPDLGWEKIAMLNIGLDFSMRKEIISGSIEYYHKRGTDLYGQTPYDYTTWGAVPYVTKNVAGIKEDGVDLIINSKNIDRVFKWNTSFLFNYNSNKTVKYESNEAKTIVSKLGNGNLIVPVLGKPLYGIAAYKWAGLDGNGNPQGYVDGKKSTDYNAIRNEGLIKGTEGNIVFVGSSSPTLFGSITNNISWRRFSFSFNISYKFGYYFVKPVLSYSSLINSGMGNKDYSLRWKKQGDEVLTNVPSFVYPVDGYRENFYQLSDVNVLKADHIRLQFVNLNFTIPEDNKSSKLFREIQLYLNVSNLGILWKANREGYDPEYPSSLPPVRSIAFGVRGTL